MLRTWLLAALALALLGAAPAAAHPEEAFEGSAGETGLSVAEERIEEGRIPGQPDFERIGNTTYRFDPNTDSYSIDRPDGLTSHAHVDPMSHGFVANPGSLVPLPSQEADPYCRSSGNRIIPVFTLRPGDSTPTPTGVIRSVLRRIEWKLELAVSQSSEGHKAKKLAVDCEAGGVIRVRRLTTEKLNPLAVTTAMKQAYGTPTGVNAVKYIAFEKETSGASGFAEEFSDDLKSTNNLIDTTTTGAVVYGPDFSSQYGNWETHATMHELLHTLGAVYGLADNPAPFSTPGYHCIDGIDVMCYSDGTKGGYEETRCPDQEYDSPALVPIDCGNDTYFDAEPVPGSWLAQNWNVAGAENLFLQDIGGVTTTTTELVQALNGNPGWVSVGGNVTNPTPINNAYVIVKFKKSENGSWPVKATLYPTLTNGHFEINNFGVGKGLWKYQVTFPAQGPYLGSEAAGEPWFDIKDGYQLVAKHSDKCLDVESSGTANGAPVQQWDCWAPSVATNQVFTLVPQGNSYYQIVARHSGKCVDVIGWSQANGAQLGQWDCNGAANQSWQGVPAGSGYSKFVAKHSGKCMDVTGGSTGNGVRVQQWDCSGVWQQQWTFKSVESGPIPTHTYLTMGATWNGEPGYQSVSGHVDAGAYSLGGKSVNVNFQREVSPGNWETVENETIHAVLDGSGNYSWSYWGVGKGRWRARTVFPSSAPFAESASEYHSFEIKSGYRLKNRYSDKCLSVNENSGANGAAIIQWTCSSNPVSGDGQVLTFVPQGNEYFNLRVNRNVSISKCVDVTGVSQSDGAKLQLWDCLGAGQANQLWQVVPIAGQEPWIALKVKHSGKCADNTGPSTANGVWLQQWNCNWTPGQHWVIQSIN